LVLGETTRDWASAFGKVTEMSLLPTFSKALN
jgi:hypothetical protein